VYVHLNAVPPALTSLVPLTDQPANVAFAFVIVLLLGVAGVKLLLYVALPELILPLPPVPAAYVTVYPLYVAIEHKLLTAFAVGLLLHVVVFHVATYVPYPEQFDEQLVFPVPLFVFPAAHAVHVVFPVPVLYDPVAHATQSLDELLPVFALYLPAAHAVRPPVDP
jgi:hypothetical protein